MKKLLLVLLLTAMGMFKGHSQALVQTYVDRCTGAVMVFSVPMNGSTVVAFYNKSRVFTAQDFQNGTLQAWLEETYLWWTSLSPCSTSTTGAQATQQTTQQTTQQATQAATNAASNAAANTTANVPTTPATPPPSNTATTQPTTTTPDTSSTNTSAPDTTTSGTNASSQGNSTSGTGGSETSTSNSQSSQGSNESTSGNETNSTEQTSEASSSGSEDSSAGDTGGDSSSETSETEVESTTEESTTEESTTEESTTEESTEETSSEESTEETTEESNESETEEETTDEQSEEETTEEESSEESEESESEESEEESDESSEEESEEEETEEESESDEDEESEEEESEEESSNEDEEEDDKKKKKKRNLAPPIVTANALSQQLPTGEFQQAVTVGISQSSLMGTETYGVNAMVYDNLQQYMITANFSKVHINKEGRINRVYSASLGAMKMFTTYMTMMNHSMTFLGKKGSVAGIALGTSLTSNNVDVIDGNIYFDNTFLGVSLTSFYTRSFVVSPKLSISPMVAASSPFMMFDMYKHNTMWNKDVMIIAGSNFTYKLTQRFGLNIGANIIESTAPEFPTMKTFTIGGRLSF